MGSVIGYQEAHGPVATFDTDVAGKIKSLAVDINPVQSGTGDPSPDNIRPITGWTGANITVNSNVITITFPSEAGTVYGGTLDVVNGVLTVDKTIVDLGTLEWEKSNLTYFKSHSLKGLVETPIDQKTSADIVCSKYQTLNYTQVYVGDTNGIAVIGNTSENDIGLLTINDLTLINNTPEEFKASLSGTMLVYKVKSPVSYTLTPQEIQTIIGTNTIYADTGDTSVIYPKTITPVETVSNVNLMELRRSIMVAMQHNYIPDITTYGVEWHYSDPSTLLTRTGNAANFSNPIPAESLSSTGSSPFDNIYPWSEMKRYNIINGEVAYSQDDVGYSETDYDTVVYIPTFYYKANKDTMNQKWSWSISSKPVQGYEKHPGSGRYVGRFHTSGSSSGVFSKGGVTPRANTTRADFRTYSHNKGSNWWQIDLATRSAIQILYLIEFANWNSQDVLGGGQNSGRVKNTGATTGAAYHTIKRSKASNTYRWIENPFSNMYTFVDGFVASERKAYIGTDPASYGDTTSGLTDTGVTLPTNGDYITGLSFSEAAPWAFIPDTATGGSGTTCVTDKVWSGTGVCVLYVGGDFYASDSCGVFCFDADSGATSSSGYLGSRLIYIPTT